MLLQREDPIQFDSMMCRTPCSRNSFFLRDFLFFFVFLFFGVVARTVGSNGPLPSIVRATESVSESGIRLIETVQGCEVTELDEEV